MALTLPTTSIHFSFSIRKREKSTFTFKDHGHLINTFLRYVWHLGAFKIHDILKSTLTAFQTSPFQMLPMSPEQ